MKTVLKNGEEIILETKTHWITLAGPFIRTIIAIIIAFIIESYGILYGLILIPVFVCYFIYKVIERNNNIWAVTNLRVVDEFGVFSNNSKESPLEKINNVSYHQTFWGKLFGYGSIQIQTAAEVGSTYYPFVTNPKDLKDTITQMQEEYKHHQIKKQAHELANAIASKQDTKIDVATELEKLYELKQKGILTEEEYQTRKTKILNS